MFEAHFYDRLDTHFMPQFMPISKTLTWIDQSIYSYDNPVMRICYLRNNVPFTFQFRPQIALVTTDRLLIFLLLIYSLWLYYCSIGMFIRFTIDITASIKSKTKLTFWIPKTIVSQDILISVYKTKTHKQTNQ